MGKKQRRVNSMNFVLFIQFLCLLVKALSDPTLQKFWISPDGEGVCSESDPCSLKIIMKKISNYTKYENVKIHFYKGDYDVGYERYELKNNVIVLEGENYESRFISNDYSDFPVFTNAETPLQFNISGFSFVSMQRMFFNTYLYYKFSIKVSKSKIINIENYFIGLWYAAITNLELNGVEFSGTNKHVQKTIFIVSNQQPINVLISNCTADNFNGVLIQTDDVLSVVIKNSVFSNGNDVSFALGGYQAVILQIVNCTFIQNADTCLRVIGGSLSSRISSSNFLANQATIFGILMLSAHTILHSVFENNYFEKNVQKRTGSLYYTVDDTGFLNIHHKGNQFIDNECYNDCVGGGAVQIIKINSPGKNPIHHLSHKMLPKVKIESRSNEQINFIKFENEYFLRNSAQSGFGGSVYFSLNTDCVVIIEKCSFFENKVGNQFYYGYGGAISFHDVISFLNLTIISSKFVSNQAAHGGAMMFFLNQIFNKIIVLVRESEFKLNSAFLDPEQTVEKGGCFFVLYEDLHSKGDLEVNFEECKFSSNSAKKGGVFSNTENYDTESFLGFKNCIFDQNIAEVEGGCFHLKVKTDLMLENCQFYENKAERTIHKSINGAQGGVGSLKGVNSLTIMGSKTTFEHNTAQSYGGVWYGIGIQFVAILQGEFNGNTAGIYGGAMSFKKVEGILIKNPVKVSNCRAKYGGGIYFEEIGPILDTSGLITKNQAYIGGGGVYFNTFPQSEYRVKRVVDNIAIDGPNLLTCPYKIKTTTDENMCESVGILDNRYQYKCILTGVQFLDFYDSTMIKTTPERFYFYVMINEKLSLNVSTSETRNVEVMFYSEIEFRSRALGRIILGNETKSLYLHFNDPAPGSIVWIIVSGLGGIVVIVIIVTCLILTCDILLTKRTKKDKYIILN